MTSYNYEMEIPVRFRDLDPMGHVNNAVFATYLEQARVEYVQDVIGEPVMETGAVVASLELDYERPIELGDWVTVGVGVRELGRTSIPMEYELRSNGDVATTAETTMVTFDREAREPRPIPEDWRERIAEHEEH